MQSFHKSMFFGDILHICNEPAPCWDVTSHLHSKSNVTTTCSQRETNLNTGYHNLNSWYQSLNTRYQNLNTRYNNSFWIFLCWTTTTTITSYNHLLFSWGYMSVESDFKKSDKSRMIFIRVSVESPCSCGHFKMRLTYVGPLVPEL